MKVAKHILPIIVISHFFCTSFWFASNGVMNEWVQVPFDYQEDWKRFALAAFEYVRV